MMIRQIGTGKDALPARFAKDELESYLIRMGAPDISFVLECPDSKSEDDEWRIFVDGQIHQGTIYGNSPRALLLGVYRYLTLIGCRFLKPGRENEYVPVLIFPADFSAQEHTAASLRHRGACLEGANSIEDILRFIDWSPKVGYNSFFFQFDTPKTFLERFYFHLGNPLLPRLEWTMEDTKRVEPYLNAQLKKRGLIHHRVGHGWTARVLGCEQTGWEKAEGKAFDAETRALMAQVNGKRELHGLIPTNTNLCLSNPEAVRRFCMEVSAYLKSHTDIDYLHIWLADDNNNSCECERCRTRRPADWYIDLLNALDETLYQEGIETRLVLLLYVDLLWPPMSSRLIHPERFLLMFAPITRSFRYGFSEVSLSRLPAAPPFELNHLKIPKDVETNLRFLKEWKEALGPVDTFDYDYYMGRAHYGDPTYIRIAKTIVSDLHAHKELGLNGYNSCQELRSQFPNGLANFVLAKAAVDTSLSYESLATSYYRDCYGDDGPKLLGLMEDLSDCFDPNYVMCQTPRKDFSYHLRLLKAPKKLDRIRQLAEKHILPAGEPSSNPIQEKHWQLLSLWVKYTDVYIRLMQEATADHEEAALAVFEQEYMPLIDRMELYDPSLIDVYRLHEIIGRTVKTSRS
ncbi:MAG: DUF4838 domain-containing protein [Firmicutes bacterium]|nr:DUF4838 domain-containing protein [Bacillota bacterium]